jgi:hypothetical protein
MDRRLPKAIFLDEAWAITSTPEGAKLVPEVSRMGRSRNTALILVSQNAGDLLAEQVTNCISSVFAFRSSERVEVANVMALLGVEPSDEHQMALRGLGNGECIFRDLEGRAGRIGIDLISDEMRQWLDTNPTRARPGAAGPGAGTVPSAEAGPSQSTAGQSSTGQSSTGQSSTGQSSTGQSSTGESSTGESGTGPSAMGQTGMGRSDMGRPDMGGFEPREWGSAEPPPGRSSPPGGDPPQDRPRDRPLAGEPAP